MINTHVCASRRWQYLIFGRACDQCFDAVLTHHFRMISLGENPSFPPIMVSRVSPVCSLLEFVDQYSIHCISSQLKLRHML